MIPDEPKEKTPDTDQAEPKRLSAEARALAATPELEKIMREKMEGLR